MVFRPGRGGPGGEKPYWGTFRFEAGLKETLTLRRRRKGRGTIENRNPVNIKFSSSRRQNSIPLGYGPLIIRQPGSQTFA